MPQIDRNTALDLVRPWKEASDNAREHVELFKTTLDPSYYFALDTEFDWEEYLTGDWHAHVYIGFNNGQATPDNLSLLLITQHADEHNHADPYIYQATSEAFDEVPAPIANDDRYERWVNDRETWIEQMCNDEQVMTVAFDVPLKDLLRQAVVFDPENKELQLVVALRDPEHFPDLRTQIDLLTYHPGTQAVIHFASMDNLSSPKPPFGSAQEESTYSLFS